MLSPLNKPALLIWKYYQFCGNQLHRSGYTTATLFVRKYSEENFRSQRLTPSSKIPEIFSTLEKKALFLRKY
jgi:hypothetical protein